MLFEVSISLFVFLFCFVQTRENDFLKTKVCRLETDLEVLSMAVALELLDRDNTLDELTMRGGDDTN